MEDIKIFDWVLNNGYSDGSGCGSGGVCNYCNGHGFGFGSGCGSGHRSGNGYGCGCGSGYSYGRGSCSVRYSGSGSGEGSGLSEFNGFKLCIIDDIYTSITSIKLNMAKGFILNDDFTTTPCFVVKGNGYFAHGKTIKEAQQALVEKYMENMDEDEVIEKFLTEFEHGKTYKGSVFFDWHHYLTGSCQMGREAFVKNHGFDLHAEYTVDEFIAACRNDYGSDVIQRLEKMWELKKTQ